MTHTYYALLTARGGAKYLLGFDSYERYRAALSAVRRAWPGRGWPTISRISRDSANGIFRNRRRDPDLAGGPDHDFDRLWCES